MPRIDIDKIIDAPKTMEENTPVPESAKIVSTTDEEIKKKSGISPISAFLAYPTKACFTGEQKGEVIILLMRAHIVTIVPWLLVSLVLFFAPSFLFPLVFKYNILPALTIGQTTSFTLFWYLASFTYAFINFLFWFFNVYIVTNKQIVDIDWYSVISHKLSSAPLAKVQDITSRRMGVLAGVFDFGNVTIQTAGELPNFDFTNVPHPQLVVNRIKELTQNGGGP
ncbi:MAG: hypothetical protein Q7S14_00550 [bacterium]|nr:hypothetical protein [bacterium]